MDHEILTTRDLGEAIRRRRRDLAWSQAELAERAGVGRPWISEVEGGKRTAEIGRVIAVMEALGASVWIRDRSPAVDQIDLDELFDHEDSS